MHGLINPICACVFAGAFLAAGGAIVATVAPQYRRILSLLAQGLVSE